MSSANVDLVRSIYAAWGRGDFRGTEWADPEIEFVRADSLEPGLQRGLAAMIAGWRNWLSAWEDYRAEADEFRALGDERVVVSGHMRGRGKASGAPVETRFVNVFHLREGRVTRLVLYSNAEHAFADLGLEPEADSLGKP